MPKIERPDITYMPSYIAALREGFYSGNDAIKTEQEIAIISDQPQKFIDNIYAVKPLTLTLPNGDIVERVPQTDFWYVDEKEFLGRISVRHRLTPVLLVSGGHIGYGVRPGAQGKGHASDMLAQLLIFCKNNLPLDKVLLTCRTDNIASAKVIEKNGGMLEDIRSRPYEDVQVKRYWIIL